MKQKEIPVVSGIRAAEVKGAPQKISNGSFSPGRGGEAPRICVLSGGSRGNCIHLSHGGASVLIDAGLSARETVKRMEMRGLSPESLEAIVVSHEHMDHISGVGPLARRFNLPVYITKAALGRAEKRLGKIRQYRFFECGCNFSIKGFSFHPFSTSHDAIDPAGFSILADDFRLGVATDLGAATTLVRDQLAASDLLVLEFNHDPDMLENGPYPWPLKQRVKSRMGHLSNQAAAELLKSVYHMALKTVILSHLSETNNTPEKALEAAGTALNHSNTRLIPACRQTPTPVIEL